MAYIEVWEEHANRAYYWNPIMEERREKKPLKEEISEWIMMKFPSKKNYFVRRSTKEVFWYLSGNFTPVQLSVWHKKFDLKTKTYYYVDEAGTRSLWNLPAGAEVARTTGTDEEQPDAAGTDDSDSDSDEEQPAAASASAPALLPPLPPLPPVDTSNSCGSLLSSEHSLSSSKLKSPSANKRYWRESLSKKSINDFISQAVASCVINYNMHQKRVQKVGGGSSVLTGPDTLEEYSHDFPAFGFGVTDHAPGIFSHLRQDMGVSMQDYCTSLGNTAVRETGSGGGRSSANFFFSEDKKFLVKTLTKSDKVTLLTILKDYYFHMLANKDSLLCHICGLYTVKPLTKRSNLQTIVVMANGLCTDLKIKHTFDLKGSSYNRYVKPAEGEDQVLKDSNLGDLKLRLGPKIKNELIGQLRRDIWFLQRNGIMDYSMLLGVSEGIKVHPNASAIAAAAKSNQPYWRRFHGGVLSNGPTCGTDGKLTTYNNVYFLTVIDLLQTFTTKKKAERILKTAKAFKKLDLSAIPPDEYATRFLNFVQRLII